MGGPIKKDRRWTAEQPSVALGLWIQTWLTTSPANHRPANFLKIKILNGPARRLRVAISASLCADFATHGNWWGSTSNLKPIIRDYKALITRPNRNVNTFSQFVTQDRIIATWSVAYRYRKSISRGLYRYIWISFLVSYFLNLSRCISKFRVGDDRRTVNISTSPHNYDQLGTEKAC